MATGRSYRFGAFQFVPADRSLFRGGEPVLLPPKAYDLLVVLVENAGHLVTKEDLLARVWPGTYVEEANLSYTVSILRKALGDEGDPQRYIETVPKAGYRFAAQVTVGAVEQTHARRQPHRRVVALLMVGVTCLGAVTAGVYVLRERSRRANGHITSIAVLPCSNLSGDVNQEYVADGMTDELTASLSRIHALTVKSRTSAMATKGTTLTAQDLAHRLQVDGLVECSVRHFGTQIDITVKLIDAATDAHVWAQTYRLDAQSVITVQDDAARDIARGIAVAVTPDEARTLHAQGTSNPEAYQAYLKGRHHFLNGRMQKAADSFSQAVNLDPRYAQAHAGLAASLSLQPIEGRLAPGEIRARAKAAAMTALQIDERVGEAHAVLAWTTLTYDWDWKRAEDEFERALTLNPSDEIAHMWYGCELVWKGSFDRGLAELKHAQELAPAVPSLSAFFGMGLYLTRRHDLAIRQLSEAIELDPTLGLPYSFLGLSLSAKGLHAEAIQALEKGAALERARPLENSALLARLGYGYAVAGQRAKATGVIDELKRRAAVQYIPPIYFAMIAAGLGNTAEAFDWLETAFERGDRAIEMLALKVEPRFDSLRADPRFQESLRRIGVP